MMLHSDFRRLAEVKLPPFQGRQMYMHTFDVARPTMARGYEDYLAPVAELCRAAGLRSGVAHMTVDEKVVQAGASQRRPGPHVDGCFMPDASRWGHPGPAWAHNGIQRMSVIVAASVPGCRAWRGRFDAEPASDGDLSHIAADLGPGDVLPAGIGYLLSPDCIHESLPVEADTARSFLRIAFHE